MEFARPDHLRVYVDTASGELATLIDDRKAVFNRLFRLFHNWDFFGDYELPRLIVASALLLIIFIAACSGLLLYTMLWRRSALTQRVGLRRIHRGIGLTVALTLLLFSLTGAYHLLWQSARRIHEPIRHLQPVSADTLDIPLAGGQYDDVRLVTADGSAYLRFYRQTSTAESTSTGEHAAHQHGEHATHANADAAMTEHYLAVASGGKAIANDQELAPPLASALTGLPADRIASTELISAFTDEYGFVFKLLPVYRVAFDSPSHPRAYVHMPSGKLAVLIDDWDYVEGWTFANLHKWHAVGEAIGRWPRDILTMLFALLQIAVATAGIMLYLRGRGDYSSR